jgi:hypothetical protein
MATPRVQLLYFDGCPLAERARTVLEQALLRCGISGYEEVDLLASATPEELRGWGSPTILIDGEDATGAAKGDDVGCRIYATPAGVPELGMVIARLEAAQGAPK